MNFYSHMCNRCDIINIICNDAMFCTYLPRLSRSLPLSFFNRGFRVPKMLMHDLTSKTNKADRHKARAPSIQRRTDRPTDRPTNRQTDQPTEWLIESRARD